MNHEKKAKGGERDGQENDSAMACHDSLRGGKRSVLLACGLLLSLDRRRR